MTTVARHRYTSYVPQPNSYGIPPQTHYGTSASSHYQARPLGTSAMSTYDSYTPSRRPGMPATPSATPSSSASPSMFIHFLYIDSSHRVSGIQFKHSPFFRIERMVSSVVECPGTVPPITSLASAHPAVLESSSQMDRRQQSVSFYITNDVIQKLESKR